MVLWIAGSSTCRPARSTSRTTVRIAHDQGVPVLADAAALAAATIEPVGVHPRPRRGTPPPSAAAGGRLRGPQGRARLLAFGRTDFIEAVRANGSPWERPARPMKVGKEEIAGPSFRAVEPKMWPHDADACARAWAAVVEAWARDLGAVPGLLRRTGSRRTRRGQPRPAAPCEGRRTDRGSLGGDGRSADGRGTATRAILVLPDGRDAFYLTPPDTLSGVRGADRQGRFAPQAPRSSNVPGSPERRPRSFWTWSDLDSPRGGATV